MATYNNSIPANPVVNDIINLTQNTSGTLPRGTYQIIAASASGGDSGQLDAAYWNEPRSGNSTIADTRSLISVGGTGKGGSGYKVIFNQSISATTTINASCGVQGISSYTVTNMSAYQTSAKAYDGTNGTNTQIKFNGSELLNITGGGGGQGAKCGSSSTLPNTVGARRNIYVTQAAKNGANGTATRSPAVSSTAYVTGNGFITIKVLSLNTPPTDPKPLTLNGKPQANSTISLTCGTSTDLENDPIDYVWEIRIDNGTWTQAILQNGANAITKTPYAQVKIPTTGTLVQFRVKARDDKGGESAYILSSSENIIHNYPPTISGTDINKGNVQAPFSYYFTVNDPDPSDTIDVTIFLDEIQTKSIKNALRNQTYDAIPDASTWLYIGMGQHTIKIVATDNHGASTTRTVLFTRTSLGLDLLLITPIKTDEFIDTVIPMFNLTYPTGCSVKIQLKNDPSANWEQVAMNNEKHTFANTTQTITGGFLLAKVTVTRPTGITGMIKFTGATFLINATTFSDPDSFNDLSRTIPASAWIANGSGWKCTTTDARVTANTDISLTPTNLTAYHAFSQAQLYYGTVSNQSYTLYTKQKPLQKIDLKMKGVEGVGGVFVGATFENLNTMPETGLTMAKLLLPAYAYVAEQKYITLDGTNVSKWMELGGSGIDATQATTTNQPVYNNGSNSFIDFANGTKFLSATIPPSIFNSPNFSIFVRVNFGAIITTGWSNSICSVGEQPALKGVAIGDRSNQLTGTITGNGMVVRTTTTQNNVWYDIALISRANTNILLCVNEGVTTDSLLGNTMDISNSKPFVIGDNPAFSGLFSTNTTAKINTLAIYDRALTSSEISTLRRLF